IKGGGERLRNLSPHPLYNKVKKQPQTVVFLRKKAELAKANLIKPNFIFSRYRSRPVKFKKLSKFDHAQTTRENTAV
ncbi:hypothetical protein, partial [Campylobacter showae]|uniref:hypothetical protein n=1 Tax=Campylobacter showae TaxID=204 RepID=UPI001980803F